jgi:acetyl-CoA C-acetyltransferase
MNDAIVIVAAKRTPIGNMLGDLSSLTATQLGAHAIKGALQQAHLEPSLLDEVIMGCVLPAGLGQAPARQAALGAGIPQSVGATTLNKMCGSGLKAVMLAHDSLLAGTSNLVCAGGLESMSNAPYLLLKGRQGYRLGHSTVYDHMFLDGLEDAYERGRAMGEFAEHTAEEYGFTREEQDAFAIRSIERAQAAQQQGLFQHEITPITLQIKQQAIQIDSDEGPRTARIEKIPHLKPAFLAGGTVTAANSSSISDGASALIITRESIAKQKGLTILARIIGHSTQAQAPNQFTTAPIGAIEKLLAKINWHKDQVDLYEINEAFAVVTLAAMKSLQLPAEKVNIHGGACVLGHPIGASGARILTTLIYALKQRQLQRGIATLCIGGGEAVALAIEAV